MVWPGGRHRYTPTQINNLYDRIDLPAPYRYEPGDFSQEVVKQSNGIGFLRALMTFMLASVPYENLELHYSTHHHISLDPDVLYDKIVTQGRGGLSLEVNAFFAILLYSLGYEVRTVAARVNEPARVHVKLEHNGSNGRTAFGAWSHMVNIVTMHDEDLLVDVGFGYGGPTHPLQLSPTKNGEVSVNIRPYQSVRLRLDTLRTDGLHKQLWMYERQDIHNGPWVSIYCFPDNIDFIPPDFEIMSYFLSTHRKSALTRDVICSKYTLDNQGNDLGSALVLLSDRVFCYEDGKQQEIAEFETEEGE